MDLYIRSPVWIIAWCIIKQKAYRHFFYLLFTDKPFRRILRVLWDWVDIRRHVRNNHSVTAKCPGDTASTVSVTTHTCPFLTNEMPLCPPSALLLMSLWKKCPSYLAVHPMFGLKSMYALHTPLAGRVFGLCVTWGGGKVLGCNMRPQAKSCLISCYSVRVVVLESKLSV